MDDYKARSVDLSQQLADGSITLGTWQEDMRAELRRVFALQIYSATGGDMPTADDWLKLGPMLKSQYMYLEDFAHQIADGTVSPDAIGSRAAQYAGSSQQAYWKQVTSEADLPAQPGDGTTQCHGNCACSWRDNNDGTWSWVLGEADHCPDCKDRARDWNPYVPEAA
jgi:hypothetical protein